MTKYIFNGDGIGIPGLPHEITKDEANAAGVGDILAAAIKAGRYKQVRPPRKTKQAAPTKGVSTDE